MNTASEPLSISCINAAKSFFTGKNLLWTTLVVYLILTSFTAVHHEMWRDELECWNIARESQSLPQLFDNIEYEGHPSLWFIILYGLSRLTSDPVAMQISHLCIGLATVFLILTCAPFSKWQRCLVVFGYFLAFEYVAISRMYGLGVLCTFLFLSQLRTNPKPWVLACILFLMAHTSIYGLLVSISLATQLPYVRSSKADANVTTVTEIAVVTVILISGWITSVLQMITPADGGYQPGWISHFEWERVIMAAGDIWKGYVPITPFTRTFWGYWHSCLLRSVVV